MAWQFDTGIFSVINSTSTIEPGMSLTFYASGTSTPLATYTAPDLVTPNANPVVCDANGRFPAIWMQELDYKVVLKNANGTTAVTRDPISNPAKDVVSNLENTDGSANVGHISAGTGAIATTVQGALRKIIHQSLYDTYAHAKAAAGNTLPLFASQQTNANIPGAKTRPGLVTGHMVIGDTDAINIDPDAYVGLFADEHYYGDVQQEMRGVSYTIRYDRSTADEAILGWDVIPVLGATVVTSDNTHDLLGNMKGVVGELIFQKPTTGSRVIRNAYNWQSTTFIEQNITVTNWYGAVIGTPGYTGAAGGTVTNGFGLFVDDLAGGGITFTNLAAIRLGGTGNSGRIWWGNSTWITQDASAKLEISANNGAISLKNILTTATATAGGGGTVPANVRFYLNIIDGSAVVGKIPVFAA